MTVENTSHSRRDFFYLAGALAVGTASGENRVKAVVPESPHIGILLATTFTTGTLEARLDAVKANGLDCVQMSMAGAGQSGPWRDFVTYAPTIHALCGLTYLTNPPDRRDIAHS